MRSIALAVLICLPALAGAEVLDAFAPSVPASANLVVATRFEPDHALDFLAFFQLNATSTKRVLDEQFAVLAKELGVDLQQEVALMAAIDTANPANSVVMGQVKLDWAAFTAACKQAPAKDLVITEDAVEGAGGAFVVLNDGRFFGGPPPSVKAAREAKGANPLAADLLKRLGSGSFGLLGNFPKGLPVPPQQPGAQLAARVRSAWVGLLGSAVEVSAAFDEPDAAEVAKSQIDGMCKTLEGVLAQQEAKAAEDAKKLGPARALHGEWIAARLAVENFKDMRASFPFEVKGAELTMKATFDPQRARMLGVAVPLAGVLAAIAVPNFKAARERANVRACFANQKTLMGAMEMYNLDKNKRVTNLDAAHMQALKADGYLQTIPDDPGQGPGSTSNYVSDDQGNVSCKFHGPVK